MSFVNTLFLYATGAALLPVLYHFVRKTQARKVPFSSLMLLKDRQEELIKRRRLRDLLLMMLRVCILALLALAFARPFLPQDQMPLATSPESQSVVLLIDNSYSMQYGDVFEAARRTALQRLDEAGPNDEFAVVAFSDEVQQLTSLDGNVEVHRSVVENELQPSNRSTNFYQSLRTAEEILQDARHENRQIVLISDLQQHGWTNALQDWKMEGGITFEPLGVAPESIENAYVEAFSLQKRQEGKMTRLRYDARVAAQGARAERSKAVRLSIDGAAVGQQAVTGASGRVTFQSETDEQRVYQGELTVDDEVFSIDNAFYVTYPVGGRPSLLGVGDPAAGGSDAFFLQKAFDVGEAARFDFEAASRLPAGRLETYDGIFLTGSASLEAAQREALLQYVRAGGTVIVALGGEQEEAADLVQGLGVGQLQEAVTNLSQEAIIGEVDMRHPVFEVFKRPDGGDVIWRPAFRRYQRVQPHAEAQVVGRFDTGDPLLIERSHGAGSILAYTSTFGTRWTDFPLHASFVPFLYQLAAYATTEAERQRQFRVGDAVPLKGQPGDTWDVRTPDDEQYKVEISEAGTGFFRNTDTPGHYRAVHDREAFDFSVNVDAQESQLQFRDQEEAYAAVAHAAASEEPLTAGPTVASAQEAEKEQKFWWYLMLGVVGLFVLETLLANRVHRMFRQR